MYCLAEKKKKSLMKVFLVGVAFLLSFYLRAQKYETIKWINNNAIKIEDADSNTKLSIFNVDIPDKFENSKIFGFGEATHHGKEFFDLKAKFFKYLVRTQDCSRRSADEGLMFNQGAIQLLP